MADSRATSALTTPTELGVGFGTSGLGFEDQRSLVSLAAAQGFSSAWTVANLQRDPFVTSTLWWDAARMSCVGSFAVGIGSVPVPFWSAPSLACAAATLADLTGGGLRLGLGAWRIGGAGYADALGMGPQAPIAVMRAWLETMRDLLAGREVTCEVANVRLRGFGLGRPRSKVPLYLGGTGRQMLRLAGELADGIVLAGATEDALEECRGLLAQGAARAGRDPSELCIVRYANVCVDADAAAARSSLIRSLLPTSLRLPGLLATYGLRGHYGRMGFDRALARLEQMRGGGASEAQVVDAFPEDLAQILGYHGDAGGAPEALAKLARGVDVLVVRPVTIGGERQHAEAVLRACRPALVAAACAAMSS